MKNILCVGGSGQLGSKIINLFKQYNVVNIDYKPHDNAKTNIILQKQANIQTNHKNTINNIKSLGIRFNAILVTAGGWTGGNIKEDNYYEKVKSMSEVNLYPSILAAHLATKYLQENGLVIFTGAASVYKQPQPEMIGYSLAKTGVHYLATNLAEKATKKQLFDGRVITILPQTIDTQSNRQAMPTADFTKWSKPEQIGELITSWVQGFNVPSNGTFVLLKVANNCIQPQYL